MLTKLARWVRNPLAEVVRGLVSKQWLIDIYFRSPDVGGAQYGMVPRGTKDGVPPGAHRETIGAVARWQTGRTIAHTAALALRLHTCAVSALNFIKWKTFYLWTLVNTVPDTWHNFVRQFLLLWCSIHFPSFTYSLLSYKSWSPFLYITTLHCFLSC